METVCGGEPVIDGLRVAVRHFATFYLRGETILESAEDLGLTEAQVFRGLRNYFDHPDEITALMAQEEQAHGEFCGSRGYLRPALLRPAHLSPAGQRPTGSA
jgi:uncharacterized protein (DUF433 family)